MASAASRQLVRWLDELGQVSDEPGRLTRTFLSPAMRRANALVGKWMRAAGLVVREDRFGNIIGRRDGPSAAAKTLLLGSHLDTVRDAGRFDGALGVLLPVVALNELRRRGIVLPFAVEVVGFSEEEGVRFSSAYLGSKGFLGRLRAAELALRDAEGVSVREAIEQWNGFVRAAPSGENAAAPSRPGELLGYVEVHIEQGPVLEKQKLAVGTVSAIAGQTRGRLTFRGKAGHAGTTPMALRRDALAGAAEFIHTAETLARGAAPLVATVGTISVSPGASNVIPGEAVISLDIRHPTDSARQRTRARLVATAQRIAKARGLRTEWKQTQDNSAVTCSPRLTAALGESVRAVQGRTVSLVSGAGHDAVVMSSAAPVAMLFVRCREGLSHHPDEYASPADIDVALRVIVEFLQRVGRTEPRFSVGRRTRNARSNP